MSDWIDDDKKITYSYHYYQDGSWLEMKAADLVDWWRSMMCKMGRHKLRCKLRKKRRGEWVCKRYKCVYCFTVVTPKQD